MKRRRALKLGLGAIMISCLGLLVPVAKTFNQFVKATLLKELSYLSLDLDSMNDFIKEFEQKKAYQSIINQTILKLIASYHPNPMQVARYAYFKKDLLAHYLRGSDFFMNGMDEAKTLTYLGGLNPYLRICSNPFTKQ